MKRYGRLTLATTFLIAALGVIAPAAGNTAHAAPMTPCDMLQAESIDLCDKIHSLFERTHPRLRTAAANS